MQMSLQIAEQSDVSSDIEANGLLFSSGSELYFAICICPC